VPSRLPSRDLALVVTFAALIAVLGLPGQVTPFGGAVPVTAQTLGVMLAGSLLGARRGALAVLVFLVLVALGLPLLAGGRGGLAVFTRPSAGYLLGWVAGAWVVGRLIEANHRPWGRFALAWALVANVVGGIVVVYAVGIPVQARLLSLPLPAAAVQAWVFLPGDLLKVVVAAGITRAVARGYPPAIGRAPESASARTPAPSSGADDS
jgi:biotin transport system substrate-specific component